MCLITEQKKPLTAIEDMVVYKLFQRDLTSPFQDFKYQKGEIYKTSFIKGDDCCFDDIDSNYLWEKYGRDWKFDLGYALKSIGQGYHASLTRKRLYGGDKKLSKNRIIKKCIIPKGSKYYLNATGLIVSNQIMIP